MHEIIAERRRAYGLKPGDMVFECGLYRYEGIRQGLPAQKLELKKDKKRDVLVFVTGNPIKARLPYDEYSHSFLLINPELHENKEEYDCLDCTVKDLKNLGSISDELWWMITSTTRRYLETITHKNPKVLSGRNLWESLHESSIEKIKLEHKASISA